MKKTIILILICLFVLTVAFCWGWFVTQMLCLVFNDNPLLVATFAIPISFFGGYFISDMCLKIYKKIWKTTDLTRLEKKFQKFRNKSMLSTKKS